MAIGRILCTQISEKDWKNTLIIDSDNKIADIGDIIFDNCLMRKVIGYAIGEDGRDCYVTSKHVRDNAGWQTYLVPIDSITSIFKEVKL